MLRKRRTRKRHRDQQEAFEKAKGVLQSADLLVHFNPDLKLIFASDPSNYGIGAVLSHKLPDGIQRPIGYLLRSLSPAERNYSIIEKKAVAVIVGVNKFHQFLYGKKFTVRADHNHSLGYLEKTKGYHHKLYLEFNEGQ